MTPQSAIKETNLTLPNSLDEELFLIWINRIERMASVEIENLRCDSITDLTINDLNKELRIPDPFSVIYPLHLMCMIYLSLGEYDNYTNIYGLFNSAWNDYAKWYVRNKDGYER